jgi:hypothetical protein
MDVLRSGALDREQGNFYMDVLTERDKDNSVFT